MTIVQARAKLLMFDKMRMPETPNVASRETVTGLDQQEFCDHRPMPACCFPTTAASVWFDDMLRLPETQNCFKGDRDRP